MYNEIIDWLSKNYYDGWTEDNSVERVKKDLKERPLDIIYGLISMIEEERRERE